MNTCECISLFLGINFACGEPAVGQFRRACVHEHVRDGWMCQDHIDLGAAHGFCAACFVELDGELAHECPITLTPLGVRQP